jgi:hypothetical protein
MKLFRPPLARLSDEEYIAKLRQTIASWQRWRF